MPAHNIIDNRREKLVDHIRQILDTSEAARFAVGYFFVSGLSAIGDRLDGIGELRLLIGNTSNRETLEQIAEGYHRLEAVVDQAEAQRFRKASEAKSMVAETAAGIRTSIELMEQSDPGQELIELLVRMIQEKRLQVRVYTKGRLHAKAYIFDYGPVFDSEGNTLERSEKGIAVVGSSNLTLSGVTHNTELNVLVHGNGNHEELVRWFDELWDESDEFDAALMQEMQQSWAVAPVSPYDIYMKTLYALVRSRLGDEDDKEILWDDEITQDLADFQKVAVRQAIKMIREYNGAFVADVVGLGKSYIGAAILKHFARTEHARPLVICPAPLVEMWNRYNETYDLNAVVLSMGMLTEGEGGYNLLREDRRFSDRDMLLVDESHNFRHSDTQRYRVLQDYAATGRRCCFLTATPRNKSAWDIYHQIKLFHPDDLTDLPINPPNLLEYFKAVERGERLLPELLAALLVRRTRNHILRWYGYDSVTNERIDDSEFHRYLTGERRAYVLVGGKHQYFPRRELETINYSIEDTYHGLYQELRSYIGRPRGGTGRGAVNDSLTYARYSLADYVRDRRKLQREPYASLKRTGPQLGGLMRILLFKRFESSVFAFRMTVQRLLEIHRRFLAALNEDVIPAGEDAQTILYEPNAAEESDLVEALREASARYDAAEFDVERLTIDVRHDIVLLERILELVSPITPDRDAKLLTLKTRIKSKPFTQGKTLIFTEYADTARYLYANLNPDGRIADMEVIFSGEKSRVAVVGRFAPKANPEYRLTSTEREINTLIATDVLSEGLNLQDCDKIINYDLHWNPVRLIQRFGRIDRIGSEHDRIWGFNFLPELGIERNLGLHQRLRNRIQEIHDTIGEDTKILDASERVNNEAMYAIYEREGGQLSLLEPEGEEDAPLDIAKAEEIIRQLKAQDPDEFARIANLRDGVRTGKSTREKGTYVFCEAGNYRQLFLVNHKGEVITRDLSRILSAIKPGQAEVGVALPTAHNSDVMRVKNEFDTEVAHRQTERRHSRPLSIGQRYVARELSSFFQVAKDVDSREQIAALERVFRGPVTAAISKELNRLRRNGVMGQTLFKRLIDIYTEHGLSERSDVSVDDGRSGEAPRIICSEALV